MNPIKLNGKHAQEKLEEVLNDVQARCTARILSVQKIESILTVLSENLSVCPKKTLKDASVTYTGAERIKRSSGSWKPPQSTHFTAVHNGTCWVVTQIWRDECPNSDDAIILDLPEEAKKRVIGNYLTLVSTRVSRAKHLCAVSSSEATPLPSAPEPPPIPSYKDFPKVSIGGSDIATLYVTSEDKNSPTGYRCESLSFGGDGVYSAYFVTGPAKIGSHYSMVQVHFEECNIHSQDVAEFPITVQAERICIYRAGEFGCIIEAIGGSMFIDPENAATKS